MERGAASPSLFANNEPAIPAGWEGWSYVRVAVERSLDAGPAPLDSALTYRSRTPIAVGRRVEVPLGRGNTPAAGIVVASGGSELLDGFDPARVKAILSESGAALTPGLVELARWIAAYYVCPLGMALSAMLPSAVKAGVGARRVTRLSLTGHVSEEHAKALRLSPKARTAYFKLAEIPDADWPLDPRELVERLDAGSLAPINRLIKLGVLRESEHDDVRATGGFEGGLGHGQGGDWAAADAGTTSHYGPPTLSPDQARAVGGIGEALGAFGVHLLRGVTGSGKTEVYLRVLAAALEADQKGTAIVLVPEISLTPQTAGRFLARLRHLGPDGVAVLHSGLSRSQRHRQWRLASAGGARVVIGARSAIFAPLEHMRLIIVDEEHADDYKQDQLPRYHGRDVAIKRAQIEGCPIILGSATPSIESWANAVAPMPPTNPVATSARPREAARGKYRLWELPSRVGGAQLPRVHVVDLAEERKLRRRLRAAARAEARASPDLTQAGPATPFDEHNPPSISAALARRARMAHDQLELIGPTLEDALTRNFEDGGQAILLLNRRGYSGYIACSDASCGYVLGCEHCDAKLVHHKFAAGAHAISATGTPRQSRLSEARAEHDATRRARKLVQCHHCLESSLLPPRCPVCDKGLIWLGMGTQRVEEELMEKFGARFGGDGTWLARVDSDSMHGSRAYFDLLSRFASGEVRVLCGTQMLAKGHDFPNVRLVGVINADTALSLPDFRAEERTFQLVSQVAGRAGRGTLGGVVIVQTMEPEAPSIKSAAAHDYVGFANQELTVRRAAGLPPVNRMARIVCRDPDGAKAERRGREVADSLRAAVDELSRDELTSRPRPRVVGPMPCPISRIAGQYRIAVEVTAGRRGVLQELLARVRARGLLKSDAHTAVDVDPISLM